MHDGAIDAVPRVELSIVILLAQHPGLSTTAATKTSKYLLAFQFEGELQGHAYPTECLWRLHGPAPFPPASFPARYSSEIIFSTALRRRNSRHLHTTHFRAL